VTASGEGVPPVPSSVTSEIVGGLIGAGVAAACLLPPIAHLVTGPLGPFIGGFVAANRAGKGVRSRIVVAATLATVLAGFVGAAVLGVSSVASRSELPEWFPAQGPQIAVLVAFVWVYAAVLAAVGTLVRAALR